MSTTMKASVHLGPSYNDILVAYRNTDFKSAQDVVRHYSKVDLGINIRGTMMDDFTPWSE